MSTKSPEATAGTVAAASPAGLGALWAKYRNFLLYAVIGCSGVVLDMALFFVLFNAAGMDEQVANVISTTAGITNNFVWNTLFNFRKRDRLPARFAKFYLVGVSGLLLTAALLWLLATVLGVDANIVKAASLPAVLLLQFWLNKRWSFG